ncbi:hypothetical protein ACDI97_10645 [Xanthomonas axonopodis pv. fascicularis]|uniref:hypothetical protein n=1 Tax=Xanthomonas axonopodis TaxID=53413 RepID=UPI00353076CD
MFQAQDIVRAFKSGACCMRSEGFSHCKSLERFAKDLGFKSYHAFRRSIEGHGPDKLGVVSVGLMRKICARRSLSPDSEYFEFQVLQSGIAFYSRWIGWDSSGDEVRVPRRIGGESRIDLLRDNSRNPVYVIETDLEATVWRQLWRSTALLEANVAHRLFPASFNKLHLVSPDPPYHRIGARSRYNNNLAPV